MAAAKNFIFYFEKIWKIVTKTTATLSGGRGNKKNSFENPHTSESEILGEIRSENATTKRE